MLGTDDTAADNAGTSLLYAGEQYDSELSQYYLRARYYNPWSGTFNRSDPFAGNNSDPQSLHKYLYAHNNPVNGIDPSGLSFMGVALAITKVVGVVFLCLVVAAAAYSVGRLAAHIWRARSFFHGIKDTDAELLGLFVPIKCKINGQIVYKYPSTILKEYRSNIISASASNGIPAAMLAGVLYTEMRDYALHDWAFTGGDQPDISIGPAQLEPEDVRRWVTEYSGKSDEELYDILMDPAQAIEVLAKALNTFKNWETGKAVIDGYNLAVDDEDRSVWSGKMSAIKDNGEGPVDYDIRKADWVIKGARGYLTALKIMSELE